MKPTAADIADQKQALLDRIDLLNRQAIDALLSGTDFAGYDEIANLHVKFHIIDAAYSQAMQRERNHKS